MSCTLWVFVPTKPTETHTRTHENPYPWLWVRVSAGTGMGFCGIPGGYPCHSLDMDLNRVNLASYIS